MSYKAYIVTNKIVQYLMFVDIISVYLYNGYSNDDGEYSRYQGLLLLKRPIAS